MICRSHGWTLQRLTLYLHLPDRDPYVVLARATILRAVNDLLGRDIRVKDKGGVRGITTCTIRRNALEWLRGDYGDDRLEEVCEQAGIHKDRIKEALHKWMYPKGKDSSTSYLKAAEKLWRAKAPITPASNNPTPTRTSSAMPSALA